MVIDNEEDRGLLLQIIQGSTIPGGAILVVAALIERIKAAGIGGSDTFQSHSGSGDNVLSL